MSTIQLVNPPGSEAVYKSFKFSQAVVANGRVEVAGQVGVTPDGSIPDEITEQARIAFSNLQGVLEAAGSSLKHVLHLTQYFTDIREARAVDAVFTEFFPENYPARTVVQVGALILPQLKLEIQASAVLSD
ncbi:MAG: RidA family protein [Candidatus Hydrogenedentes bacterium]|nr:RidA family protein [Candidatus Hydrogenedentota bacterium]